MRLVPFEQQYAALVLSWARTAEELDAWAALAAPAEPAIFGQWLSEPDTRGHVLLRDEPVAYGELWISEAESEVELAHILVSPDHRRQGVGRALVAALVEQSRGYDVTTVWVRVVATNVAALRCYRAAGFAPVPATRERALNAIQPRAYRWLSRHLGRDECEGNLLEP